MIKFSFPSHKHESHKKGNPFTCLTMSVRKLLDTSQYSRTFKAYCTFTTLTKILAVRLSPRSKRFSQMRLLRWFHKQKLRQDRLNNCGGQGTSLNPLAQKLDCDLVSRIIYDARQLQQLPYNSFLPYNSSYRKIWDVILLSHSSIKYNTITSLPYIAGQMIENRH